MKTKKSRKADIERFRGLFFRFGMALSIILVIAAFKWTKEQELIGFKIEDKFDVPEDIDIKLFSIEKEPVKIRQAVLKPVDDEQVVDSTNTDFLNVESKPTDSIPLIPDFGENDRFVDTLYEISLLESKPEFPGGNKEMYKFLKNNLVYPELERQMGIQGRVVVSFVVNLDGSITDIQVIKGVTPNLNEETIRVIRIMPKWVPGRQRDHNVSTRISLPILFTLSN